MALRVTAVALVAVFGAAVLHAGWKAQRPEQRWAAWFLGALLLSPGVGSYHVGLALVAGLLMCIDVTDDGPDWTLRDSPGLRLVGLGLALLFIPVEYGLGGVTDGPLAAARLFLRSGWGTLLLSPHVFGLTLMLAGLTLDVRRGV